jgi:hypothetical protein
VSGNKIQSLAAGLSAGAAFGVSVLCRADLVSLRVEKLSFTGRGPGSTE